MPDNPFYPKAGEWYTAEEVLHYYCQTDILPAALQPRNQALFGGPGTGKSLLMRRLAYSTHVRASGLPNPEPFIGVYVSCLRDLAILNTLLETSLTRQILERFPDMEQRTRTFAVHFICLAIAAATCRELVTSGSVDATTAQNACSLDAGAIESIASLCRLTNSPDRGPAGLLEALDRACNEMRISVANNTALTTASLDACHLQSLSAFAQALTSIVGASTARVARRHYNVYFLFDQYEHLDVGVQQIVNTMLTRSHQYVTKIALRPYALHTLQTVEGSSLIPGDDFVEVYVEYSKAREPQYCDLLDAISARLMGDSSGLRPLLPADQASQPTNGSLYHSYLAICRLSAGAVMTFLDTCAEIVRYSNQSGERAWRRDGVDGKHFYEAAVSVAQRQYTRVSSVKGSSGEQINGLIDGLLRRLASDPMDDVISVTSPLGNLSAELPADSVRTLRKAFEYGALKFASERDASLFQLPTRFVLNPVFYPRRDIPVE